MIFKTYDMDQHELDDRGRRVIQTSHGPYVVEGVNEEAHKPAYFGFECPRGHGLCNYLRIRGGPRDDGQNPTWVWDGDHVNPTLEPSINCLSHNPDNPSEKYAGCGWHGWIKNGERTGA